MTHYIYLAVRVVVVAWVLYRLWRWLHYGPVTKLWDRIPVRVPKPKAERVPAPPRAAGDTVVGATNVEILENPRTEAAPVAHSVELKDTGYIGEDEGVSPDDVETDYKPSELPPKPSPDELYDDEHASYGPDPRMSSGMSFESIGDAVTVLVTDDQDEQRRARAAQTLYELQNTPVYDFITREVSNTIAMDNLVKEYINEQ